MAVDGLSFTVEKGQIYGFLGPNGAGKSTTMNIMTGYIAASNGTVRINGFDILKQPLKAKGCIGYLPEIPPLYPDMTVWEYLMFVAQLKKVPKKERYEHLEQILEKIQLEDVADRLIKNLSKGYKQRVGLAQALVGNPEVLILDEPMVGMDPRQIMDMRDLLRELAKEHTILLSSHILSEISAVCDHIMIISHGKLAASGSPEELQETIRTRAEMELTVCAEKKLVEELLSEMEAIAEYTVEEMPSSENVRVCITERENEDIRKELSVKLSGAGAVILSMNRKESSLEDIFLELTQNETQESAGEQDSENQAKELPDEDAAGDTEETEDIENTEDIKDTEDIKNTETIAEDTDTMVSESKEAVENDSDL